MDCFETAKNVLALEAKMIEAAKERLLKSEIDKLVSIYEYLRNVGGALVFCGVGKSGLIGQKLAATFCSLGLPSYFLHPVEALHGDLGRVGKQDAIVFLSKSGSTEEIIKLLPFLDIPKEMTIGLLGELNSPIALKCGVLFDCSVTKEASINNQAPTTSSTLTLAMGDALAVVFEQIVGLSKEGFAQNHPGGILGKSLRLRVRDLMWHLHDCPILPEDSNLQDVILAMTKYPVGGAAIINKEGVLQGIIVEGDIRRTFTRSTQGLHTSVKDIMTSTPVVIGPDNLAYDAMKLMEKRTRQIDLLPVINQQRHFLGFIRLHDLLKEGFHLETTSKN